MRHLCATLAFLSTLSLGAATAGALTIDFDGYTHGQDVGSMLFDDLGIVLTTVNLGGGPNLGVAFDTTLSLTRDEDLQRDDDWAYGNLRLPNPVHDPVLDRILIIQENDNRCDDGFCADDEGSRPAGWFSFDLSELPETFSKFSFDLVDIDDPGEEMEDGSIVFTYQDGDPRMYRFEDFVLGQAIAQDVQFGNRSANHIDLGPVGAYDRIVVHMGGSGGIDNLVLTPEPGTLALVGLGLGGLAIAGRRRR